MGYKLQHILFLDIETITVAPDYEALDDRFKKLWQKKSRLRRDQFETEEDFIENLQRLYADRAGIFSEFAKIACISCGFWAVKDDEWRFRVKTFSIADGEKTLLEQFSEMCDRFFKNTKKYAISGHNIKEFDVPFICRRMLIHGLPLPAILDVQGKKPWETEHLLDTMQMWRFGDYKNYTSLDTLAACFDIPSSKTSLDGSMVSKAYWQEDNLKDIITYCEADVLVSMQVYAKMAQAELPEEFDIDVVR